MPISMRTTRDIWDEKRMKMKEKKEIMRRKDIIPAKLRGDYLRYFKAKEKSLVEIRKYL